MWSLRLSNFTLSWFIHVTSKMKLLGPVASNLFLAGWEKTEVPASSTLLVSEQNRCHVWRQVIFVFWLWVNIWVGKANWKGGDHCDRQKCYPCCNWIDFENGYNDKAEVMVTQSGILGMQICRSAEIGRIIMNSLLWVHSFSVTRYVLLLNLFTVLRSAGQTSQRIWAEHYIPNYIYHKILSQIKAKLESDKAGAFSFSVWRSVAASRARHVCCCSPAKASTISFP